MLDRPLSIDEQRRAMLAAWPMFACRDLDRAAQSARWVGTVIPQFTRYSLKIRYRLGRQPDVRVLNPALVRLPENSEGELPHVFPPADDPTLCLFDPRTDEWNASMAIAQTIAPWAFDWIACYELWLMTGRWTGGGRHATNSTAEAA